jgi:predicted esterase
MNSLHSLLVAAACLAPAVAQSTAQRSAESGVEAALVRAGARRPVWEDALERCAAGQRPGLAFLLEHMPQPDLDALDPELVLENVRLAYEARAAVPWGAALADELFFNDVLPYANVNEPRDPWRRQFVDLCLPLVEDCATPGEAAHKLNQTIFGVLNVKYSTKRQRADQSPRESIEQGLASCTGLSIVLADACRAVCVPARLAGISSWANKRGNHTWVEVWDGGDWHFAGAAEPDGRGLDHAWFTADARLALRDSRLNAIYAASWRRTGTLFPLPWLRHNDYVHAVNVTDRYTGAAAGVVDPRKARLMVEVKCADVRLAARVQVVDVERRDIEFLGESRGEQADTNDYLTFEVPKGRSYEVRTWVEDRWELEETVEVGEQDQRIVRIARPVVRASVVAGGVSEAELAQVLDAVGRAARSDSGAADERALREAFAADPAAARALAWAQLEDAAPPLPDAQGGLRTVTWKEHASPYTLKEVGERPAGGWPLFIAMHGGGGVPKAVNDSQWEHMQVYYKDHPEVGGYKYLALRAPDDTWNGFYNDTISGLVEELVAQLLVHGDVDPDRVFLMGYSHGGYGAFVIGTKIPYRFAQVHASAAAPSDGETQGANLRATRFTYMVGEKDTAYGRIERARAFERLIAELKGGRDDIYPATFEYQAGFGHGGLPDRDKIPTMYHARRDAAPREVTWVMTDGLVQDFFWLHVPTPGDGQRVDAVCRDNVVTVKTQDVARLTLWFDERLVDLAKPVTMSVNGETTTVVLEPKLEHLLESMRVRRDPQLAFTARVDLELE